MFSFGQRRNSSDQEGWGTLGRPPLTVLRSQKSLRDVRNQTRGSACKEYAPSQQVLSLEENLNLGAGVIVQWERQLSLYVTDMDMTS